MVFPRDTAPAGEVIRTGKPLLLEHRPPQVDAVTDRPMGPVAVVPLTLDGKVFGALVVSRLDARPPFNSSEVDALLGFSKAAGTALEMHRDVADRGHLQLYDDRVRIAHELHDQVVRQLFAVGMGLEGLIEALPDPELRARVSGYVAALDGSVRAIRETIYRVGDG
jgi:signal transduction histidine kinase